MGDRHFPTSGNPTVPEWAFDLVEIFLFAHCPKLPVPFFSPISRISPIEVAWRSPVSFVLGPIPFWEINFLTAYGMCYSETGNFPEKEADATILFVMR